jgi:hypothetical protein
LHDSSITSDAGDKWGKEVKEKIHLPKKVFMIFKMKKTG